MNETWIELYWMDLAEDIRAEIIDILGEDKENVNNPSFNNWDVVPLAMIPIYSNEEDKDDAC